MSNVNPMRWLTPVFLWRLVEKRPNDGKRGFRQRYLSPEMAPFENVWTRKVLVQRSKEQNPLAGFYSEKGEALPATDIGYDQMLMGLQDIKATRYLDPDLYSEIVEIGELAVGTSANTQIFKRKSATVLKKLNSFMAFCDDQVDTSMEYLFMHALQGQIDWPPTNDTGAAIANPPDYWNGHNYIGSWPYPIEANKNQAITTLTDYEGNNPGASIRTAWNDTSADILGAIRTIKELMLELYATDLTGGTMIMPTTLYNDFLTNTGILNWVAGANKEQEGARRFMSDEELKTVLRSFHDINIRRYDSFWTYETAPTSPHQDTTTTKVKFLKPGKVIFIPPGGVNCKMGTVPLKTGPGASATWRPGKFAWTYEAPKPTYPIQVGVNVVAWPLFEDGHYDWFILDALN